MKEQTIWKTFTSRLMLTTEHQPVPESVLCRWWELYITSLVEHRDAWQKSGMSVTEVMQSAQLPDIKEARPKHRDIHPQDLQDVVTRLDKASEAFFRCVKNGKTLGFPRCRPVSRYSSITYKQFSNGTTLDNSILVPPKIGRIVARWSCSIRGMPKTATISREADGWYVCFSCALQDGVALVAEVQKQKVAENATR